MKKNIIITPFPGDELIGNFEILIKEEPTIIIYTHAYRDEREEAIKLKEQLKGITQIFNREIPYQILSKEASMFFPDPIYENFPEYREIGVEGEKFWRNGFDVCFFSVSMTAPYLHRVEDCLRKENFLKLIYQSKKYMWENKKYFLLEGRCKWLF